MIHTDHLSNTTLSENLSNPDKILRMLLKVDYLVRAEWCFAPGKTQVGDGVSRNPPDRDQVRDECEQKTGLPKTLNDAFEAVSKSSLGGSMLDDADSIMQLRLAFCDRGDFDMRPPIMRALVAGKDKTRVRATIAGVTPIIPCLVLPTVLEHDEDPSIYDSSVTTCKKRHITG